MPSKPASQWSAAYAKRMARAEAKGLTRQQARGHKAGEHVIRKERKALRDKGQLPPPSNKSTAPNLTKSQRASVRGFADRQAVRAIGKDASKAEVAAFRATMLGWANKQGYGSFQELRALIAEAREQYESEVESGTWESRGIEHTLQLWAEMMDYPDMRVFFYH